ncbi:ParB-like nuclease domain-containing protein [Desulfovibrio sp. PG-178-WT-4]|uniref:ParB-like nuclease domain-containing protein n=1 Tax=Desulfovibrio porci TaxID=2605782 RepID=A0A6L5XJ82_9BACT|nr:ParB/RepB/Spo0J family partition protein [Desulfovibrio porci]MSS27280.1 ParB-like nuclease domain-containing protein [Desulfovibrio porci]
MGIDELLSMLERALEDEKGDLDRRVAVYNQIVAMASAYLDLPHPVTCPQLVPVDRVHGNEYNPNKVAPPEMRLLTLSIEKDGMTMPVVVADDKNGWVVVDGFHRRRVAKAKAHIRQSLGGYLPIVRLNKSLEDRITSTVRHNMARGAHQVELTAKLVTLLRRHNWTNERIGKELGMDPDEVLRLKQMQGLAEAFSDREFSRAWDVDAQTRAAGQKKRSDSRL